ncbi:MAG TPA: C4-dicarboxylic acid transporter DauA [Vicinamibacteria bacterium]|nr:C4-dicarboxylic acid transporter DauA [Vicinamibacteria bacterium]
MTPPLRWGPALALRQALQEGYSRRELQADVMAGLVVGIVALPLSMALAIASGVAPQYGLYTAIVAGAVIAVLGGSRVQVSGPTAAFVVILAPVATRFGLRGLLLATLMAGVILVALGLGRMGRLIVFVPYPVITGFTAGIAVVIATLQVKDFLGLTVTSVPEHYLERVAALAAALPTVRPWDVAVGALTLALLVLWPRVRSKVPAPLVALGIAALVAAWAAERVPGFEVATVASQFSGIPQQAPAFLLPWALSGPDGAPGVSFDLLRALLPSAFAIAMLGAMESLLSAVVADGMTGRRHDPDAELLAQGLGNLVAPFFGGFAATGAIARTATSVRSGARSPVAAVVHSLFVLLAVLLLAPLLGRLPMASLAALLLVVAWNMSERKHFRFVVRAAPRSDIAVLLVCFGLTIVFDMVVSITAGIILSSMLFIRRMAEVSGVRLVGDSHPELREPLPRGIVLYEVAGPLFFGAAQAAMNALQTVEKRGVQAVVLDLQAVPAMDATGLVNLESLLKRLNGAGVKVILAGVQAQPMRVLAKAGWRNRHGRLRIFRSFERAIGVARAYAAHTAGERQAEAASPARID